MTSMEIQNMSLRERLQVMELLWDSIIKDENKIESPNWHDDVLKERKAKIDKNESGFISLEELKARRK